MSRLTGRNRFNMGCIKARCACCGSSWPVGRRQSGFTYFGVLFLVVVMGLVLATAGTVWGTFQKSEKERELLFIGREFQNAIQSYYERSPGLVKRYPPNLEELLKDSRYVSTERHLRKLYRDPMTGKPDWGVVEAAGGGVAGVFSQSKERPLKTANFDEVNKSFEGKAAYSDWKFVYLPASMQNRGAAPNAP